MCKFASFVLTKGEEFWSDKSDSHEAIITEYDLHHVLYAGKPRSIRARLPCWSWRASILALLGLAIIVTALLWCTTP